MRWLSVFGSLILVQILLVDWSLAQSSGGRPEWVEGASPLSLEWGVRKAIVDGDCELVLTLIDALDGKMPELGLLFRGELREKGRCLPRDLKIAFALYTKANEAGSFAAGFLLGYMHLNGLGTPMDREKALFWFRRAALGQRPTPIPQRLARAKRYIGNRPFPAELLAEIDWVWRVDQGDPREKYLAAVRVQAGKDVPRNCMAAKRWLWRAATDGLPEAQLEMAHWYFDGICTAKDLSFAKSFLYNAARSGFLPAVIELGRRHLYGRGIRKHDLAAYAWLLSAQAKGADVAADLLRLEAVLDDIDRNIAREWSRNPGGLAPYP
jgi:uncharacterized protein